MLDMKNTNKELTIYNSLAAKASRAQGYCYASTHRLFPIVNHYLQVPPTNFSAVLKLFPMKFHNFSYRFINRISQKFHEPS